MTGVRAVAAHADGSPQEPRPISPGLDPQPHPLVRRGLPEAVWGDHLLPLLTFEDAARLGGACKALRGVVRGHFKFIGRVPLHLLQAALTTFPGARSVAPYHASWPGAHWGDGHEEVVVEWLREGGRGVGITTMTTTRYCEHVTSFIHAALRAGALPSLKAVAVRLGDETQRAALTQGLLGGMHELGLLVECSLDMEAQLGALGLVRQLPALTKLELRARGTGVGPERWPPFIPPSLKALCLRFTGGCLPETRCPPIEPLLRALPGILGASGARLERLEVHIPFDFDEKLGDGLVHLAQALRCCSPTLKAFLFKPENGYLRVASETEDYEAQEERLRVQWWELLAGVSACRELQVLILPYIEVEPLFPPGTAFGHLTSLEISAYKQEYTPAAGRVGLWELMASGGLPALAKLLVGLNGFWWVGDVVDEVVPGLEAVAGTLTHLHLAGPWMMWTTVSRWRWGASWGWRWASVGGSGSFCLAYLVMAGPTTPWPKAWPPVAGSAPSPCCGKCLWASDSRLMPTCWRACSFRVCGSSPQYHRVSGWAC
jgi:hypothetical protein